jgi:hypothetical protein
MKKRLIVFMFLITSFLFMFSLAAKADILIEPNNNFYEKNAGECVYVGRSFYANGPSGYVSVKEAPGVKKEIAVIENGASILIQFTYDNDGEAWGATIMGNREKPDGWMPMEQLVLVYDYMSFDEEHQDEYYPYSGDYEELFAPGEIVFWTWPGSGVVAWVLEEQWRNPDGEAGFLAGGFEPPRLYEDFKGREWVFIGYLSGIRNTWACLSDQANKDIPAFNPPPKPQLFPPAVIPAFSSPIQPQPWPPGDALPQPSGSSLPVLIIILVAAVVAVTAVLIRVFWKKK